MGFPLLCDKKELTVEDKVVTSSTPKTTDKTPTKTGDDTSIMLFITLLALSAFMVIYLEKKS